MKTLLVLFDNPNISKGFVRYAILLARDLKANVQLLFVQTPPAIPLAGTGTMSAANGNVHADTDALAKSVEKLVDEVIRDISDTGIKVEYKSEPGATALILEEKVSKEEFDMVLLEGGTDKPFWVQTNTNMELIEKAKCPVLIIAPNTKYQPLKKIIYASDYKEEDLKTLKELINLTKPFVIDILALHISKSMEFSEKVKKVGFKEMLERNTNFNNISLRVLTDEKEKDIVETLSEEVDRIGANLIVVLKENRNFFERIFKSSFTANVIKNAELPVLVFYNEK